MKSFIKNIWLKISSFVRENKKVVIVVVSLILIILFFSSLIKDRQRDLPYRVSGQELLEIKEKCKNLAEEKKEEWNNSGLAFHTLEGYGYSEFRGTCYAEYIRNFNLPDSENYKVLYDTIEEKELNIRGWPDNISWYDSDFDHIILGRYRIWDIRQP